MPELPEVETIARQLRARGVEGRTILSARVEWARAVEPLTPTGFSRRVSGARIESLSRYGKWLLFALDTGRTIMVHLRMSGAFSMESGPHDRLVLPLSGGMVLYFRDPRKFGRWKLVADPREILAGLGPDALTPRFSLGYFNAELQRHHRQIKPLLLDQSVVAGLGNIYVDEALWTARIHPERSSALLSVEEVARLHAAIRSVLRTGVRNRGTSLGEGRSNYRDVDGGSGGYRERVKAYGRAGKPCAECGAIMERFVVAQRGTTICPRCQKP